VVFLKLEDNGAASLLIIYHRALRATVFWRLHQPRLAGWLWTKLQAEPLQHGQALLLSVTSPPLL